MLSKVLPERASTHSPPTSILYRRTSPDLGASINWVSNCPPPSKTFPSEEYSNHALYVLLITPSESQRQGTKQVRHRLKGPRLHRSVTRQEVLPDQKRAVDHEREQGEKNDEAIELRHVVEAHALHEDVAQPALRSEHLGEHDPQERYAEAYPQPRGQRRQYRREDYRPEELQPR